MKKLVNVLMTLVLCCTIFFNGSLSVNATGASAEVDVEDLMKRGQEAFNHFVEVSAFIQDDETWNDCLEVYDIIHRKSGKEMYLESVDGASEELWDNLTAQEILVYYDTYLVFASIVTAANDVLYNKYIADIEHGVNEYVGSKTLGWNGNNCEEVIAAFEDFVEWQIEYYRIYNFPYNFITGKSYAEETHQDFGLENAESEAQEPVVESIGNEAADITEEEKNEILDELTNEEISEIKEEVEAYESASFEEEKDDESGNIFIPIVLVVVAGVALVAVVLKKRK